MRSRTGILTTVLVMVILAGCARSSHSSSAADTAPPTAIDLGSVLATDLPPGFRELSKGGQPNNIGPLDLATAARFWGTGDEARQHFVDDDFRAGYHRMWIADDPTTGRQVEMYVYQFGGADGAASFRDRALADVRATPSSQPFEVAALPDSSGAVLQSQHVGVQHEVFFTVGAFTGEVIVNGADVDAADLASRLATAEDQALQEIS